MIDIRALASGSSGNCYYIADGSTSLLLECGISIADIRRGLDYQLSNIEGCLITHEHKDHARVVEDIMKAGIDCYMSSGTKDALGLSSHRAITVKPCQVFNIGTWRIIPFDVYHDSKEPLGFLLISSVNKVLFLTDTGSIPPLPTQGLTHILIESNYSPEIIEQNVQDGLIPLSTKRRIESSHLSINQTVEFFKSINLDSIEEIWLIHLSNDNSNESMFKRAVQAATAKPVFVAPVR